MTLYVGTRQPEVDFEVKNGYLDSKMPKIQLVESRGFFIG